MPANRRPARAVAVTVAAEESRRRLLAIGAGCTLAALLAVAAALLLA